jgi:hypothetical protein
MALSPQYSWPEPDNSSLVKNGAQDIRALGDAIDTSVWNVGYGQAGKNKIINGDFTINQRAFSSTTTSNTYGLDRWVLTAVDGTTTWSVEQFTAGTAPVAGYESKQFSRVVTTGQTLSTANSLIAQRIENVRNFAGQPVTVSFWAKAGTGTPKVAVELSQFFGSGGSPSAQVNTYLGQATLSTSWARYSVTTTLPSLTGLTVGTTENTSSLNLNVYFSRGSDGNARTGSLGIQSNTFDTWGFQVEYGSTATPFQTASGGSIQGELAMCQRYYWRQTASTAYGRYALGFVENADATKTNFIITPPVPMRVVPTSIDVSTLQILDSSFSGGGTITITISSESNNFPISILGSGSTGLTANRVAFLRANNSTSAFLGFSAEL